MWSRCGTALPLHPFATFAYKAKVVELLNSGETIGDADVCRALGKTNAWRWRYWRQFRQESEDALEGDRKVKWRGE
jgi:hypothetical protein